MTGAFRAACRSILLSAALMASVAERPAFAQPQVEPTTNDERAHALFRVGDAAYSEGRYEDALRAFSEAYQLSGRPQLLFNLANCHEHLGRNAEAIDALEKYLATANVKDRDPVEGRIVRLKRLEARGEAADPRNEREPRGEEIREAAPVTQSLPTAASSTGVMTDKPSSSVVPWVLVGGGAALVLTGSVFGILTLDARSDAKAGCSDSPAGHVCDEGARSALDREKTFGLVADIGIASGLLLGGIGTYLLVTDKPKPPPAVRVGVGSAPGGGKIDVRVAF
jgi:hypothetical protein